MSILSWGSFWIGFTAGAMTMAVIGLILVIRSIPKDVDRRILKMFGRD